MLASAQDEASLAVAASHRAWLASGATCGSGADAEAVEGALLDIHVLLGAEGSGDEPHAPGSIIAGWEDRWRYVWPRDAAFVATALAATGHHGDAVEVLAFLADATIAHGSGFAARYLPTGDGVPDRRHDQLDGAGWVLWAGSEVLASPTPASPSDPSDVDDDAATRLRPLLARAATTLLDATDNPEHLPPASSDYWERVEHRLTLGTAAVVLAGLEAAGDLGGVLGPETAAAAREGAGLVRAAVVDHFGPDFRRYGGSAFTDGRDAALGFLLPPIGSGPEGAHEAWLASIIDMGRVSGGLAPGATWRRDAVSWTPETTLYALTAAANDEPELRPRAARLDARAPHLLRGDPGEGAGGRVPGSRRTARLVGGERRPRGVHARRSRLRRTVWSAGQPDAEGRRGQGQHEHAHGVHECHDRAFGQQEPRSLDARRGERRVAAEEPDAQRGHEHVVPGVAQSPPGEQSQQQTGRHVHHDRAERRREPVASRDRRVQEEPRGGTEPTGRRDEDPGHPATPRSVGRRRDARWMPAAAAAMPSTTLTTA